MIFTGHVKAVISRNMMSKGKVTLAASKCDSHRRARTWYQGRGKRSLAGIAMGCAYNFKAPLEVVCV